MAKKPSKTEQSEQELNAQAQRIYKVFQATKTRSTSNMAKKTSGGRLDPKSIAIWQRIQAWMALRPPKKMSEREENKQAARYYRNYQATKLLHVPARREPTAESRDFVRRLAERLQPY